MLNERSKDVVSSCHNSTYRVGAYEVSCLLQEGTFDLYSDESRDVYLLGTPRQYTKREAVSGQNVAEMLSKGMSVAEVYPTISGRFVLIVVDKLQQKVFCVNDHTGSIPFYLAHVPGAVILSPSMGLIEHQLNQQLTLSSQAIYHYIYFHCIPAPLTIYQEVEKLCPAELVRLGDSGVEQRDNLYCPDFASAVVDKSSLHKACFEQLENAVEHNLGDKDVGAFLSGGLDSSTVAGLLAKIKGTARTFSIGFNEPGYDETEFALITAKHFNTQHQTSYLEPDYITDNFVTVATAFDEPFGNSSALAAYYCASVAKQAGIDTMLAGDGGDEFFAGNTRYARQKLYFPYERSPAWLKSLMRGVFVGTPLSRLPLLSKVASYIRQAEEPLPDRLQAYNFLHRFKPEEVFTAEFLADINQGLPLEQLRSRYQQAKSDSPIDNLLYLDWKFTLADNDLIKVSKMCELAGVDVRFPLIEKELVDFSCQVPASMKLPGHKLRHFFKESTRNFLAEATLNKSKHGFGLPFGRWMRSTPGLVEITQTSMQQLKQRQIFRAEFIDKAFAMQSEQHAAYYGELIWIMTVLEQWLQSRSR